MTAPVYLIREERDRWVGRLAALAKHIPPGSRVLDLGCGAGGLAALLPPGCEYTGLDLPDIDLNTQRWPTGYDVLVLAGVLEYLDKPGRALRLARRCAPVILMSYAHRARDVTTRRNLLSRRSIVRLCARARLEPEALGRWRGQVLYRLMKRKGA